MAAIHPLSPRENRARSSQLADDLLWLQGDEEDAAVPDKESDIKPRHYSGKTHGLEQNGEDSGAGKRVGAYGEELDEGDEDD